MNKTNKKVPEIRFPGFTDDWEQRKLSEVLTERHCFTTITDEYPRLSFTIEEGVISPEDRKTNKRDFLMKDEMNKKFLVTEIGDIIYNPANVVFGALHKNKYAKGCLSPIYRIFYSDFDTTYLECIMRSDAFIQALSQKTEGTVVKLKTLKPEAFLGMKIFVTTSFEEQKKIAKYFDDLDNLITLHQRKCDQLQILKKSMLQKMFPKKGENVPEIRFPGFTDDWEQRKLPEFVTFYNGLTYTPNDVAEEGTFVLRSSNVKNGEIVDADNVYVNSNVANSEQVLDGDIIVVVRNGSRALIGKHAQIKGSMPNTVIGAFMSGIRSEHNQFVNALLDTPAFEKEIAKNMGATINQITGYMFAQMGFMIPSEKEQDKIGEYFSNLDNLITLHQRKCNQLKELKKSMLQKMFV